MRIIRAAGVLTIPCQSHSGHVLSNTCLGGFDAFCRTQALIKAKQIERLIGSTFTVSVSDPALSLQSPSCRPLAFFYFFAPFSPS